MNKTVNLFQDDTVVAHSTNDIKYYAKNEGWGDFYFNGVGGLFV